MRQVFLAAAVAFALTLPLAASASEQCPDPARPIHVAPLCLTQAEYEAGWTPWGQTKAPGAVSVALVGEPLVRQLVETYFQPEDWSEAMRVAKCESGFLAAARNPRSTATGTWQFLRSTWAFVAPAIGAPGWPDGALDPHWSTRGAAWLWYKIGPWQWSCW